MLGLLRLGPGTPIAAIWWNFALLGAGIGLCLTPMTTIAVAAVDPSGAGMASAIHNALRQVGHMQGVAVLGALVYAHLPSGPGAGRALSHLEARAFVDGLHNAIWVAGVALLAAALLAALTLSVDTDLRRKPHVNTRRLRDHRKRSQPERTQPEGPPSPQRYTSPGTTSRVSGNARV